MVPKLVSGSVLYATQPVPCWSSKKRAVWTVHLRV